MHSTILYPIAGIVLEPAPRWMYSTVVDTIESDAGAACLAVPEDESRNDATGVQLVLQDPAWRPLASRRERRGTSSFACSIATSMSTSKTKTPGLQSSLVSRPLSPEPEGDSAKPFNLPSSADVSVRLPFLSIHACEHQHQQQQVPPATPILPPAWHLFSTCFSNTICPARSL